MQGYGLEFDCQYYGGPYDGLKSIVISLNEKVPPQAIFEKITEEIQTKKTPLGRKVLDKLGERHIPDDQQVAIYKIRGSQDDYDDDEDIVAYDHVETTSFLNFKKRYWK